MNHFPEIGYKDYPNTKELFRVEYGDGDFMCLMTQKYNKDSPDFYWVHYSWKCNPTRVETSDESIAKIISFFNRLVDLDRKNIRKEKNREVLKVYNECLNAKIKFIKMMTDYSKPQQEVAER